MKVQAYKVLEQTWAYFLCVYGGGRRLGAWENTGREGYGRQEKRRQETVLPSWWEMGKIWKTFETLHNILQQK